LTLDAASVSKVSVSLAGADRMIDCFEFLRAFAWHDIYEVEDDMIDAKMNKSAIAALAMERLAAFFGRTA